MRLDRDDIDAHDRDTEPSVDDDALVENSIKNLDLAAGRAGSLDNHAALSSRRLDSGRYRQQGRCQARLTIFQELERCCGHDFTQSGLPFEGIRIQWCERGEETSPGNSTWGPSATRASRRFLDFSARRSSSISAFFVAARGRGGCPPSAAGQAAGAGIKAQARLPSKGHATVDGDEPRFSANVQPCSQRTAMVPMPRVGRRRRRLRRGVNIAARDRGAGEAGRTAVWVSATVAEDFR